MSWRTFTVLAALLSLAAVGQARPHRHSEDRRAHSHYRTNHRSERRFEQREREWDRDQADAQSFAARPLPRLQQLADTVAAMARQQAEAQAQAAQPQPQAQTADSAAQSVPDGFSFAAAGGRARHREESGGINFYYDASNMPSWLSPPWVTSAFRTGPLALPNPGEGSTEEGPMFMGVPPQPILPFDSQLPAEAQPISTNLANYPTNAIPTGADLNAGQSPPVTTANSQPGANQPGEAQSPAEQQADGGQAEGGDEFLFLLQVAAHHHAMALHHMRQHQHALHSLKQRHAARMDTVADAHDRMEQQARGQSDAQQTRSAETQLAESGDSSSSDGPEPDFSTLIETNAHESSAEPAGPAHSAPPVSFQSSAAYQRPFAWMHDYGYPTSNTAYRTWQPYYPQQAYPFPPFGFPH